MNGLLITFEAWQLGELCNRKLPANEHVILSFCGSWRTKLKRRQRLKRWYSRNQHCAALLHKEISAYCRRDVYSADEREFFRYLALDLTISLQQPRGRKKPKEKETLLMCSNLDGSDKQQLFFISSALTLKALKKKKAKNMVLTTVPKNVLRWPQISSLTYLYDSGLKCLHFVRRFFYLLKAAVHMVV